MSFDVTTPFYENIDELMLKCILAQLGLDRTNTGAHWMAIHPNDCLFMWPLRATLQFKKGTLRVGEIMYVNPCEVFIPSIQAFRIVSPISFTARFVIPQDGFT